MWNGSKATKRMHSGGLATLNLPRNMRFRLPKWPFAPRKLSTTYAQPLIMKASESGAGRRKAQSAPRGGGSGKGQKKESERGNGGRGRRAGAEHEGTERKSKEQKGGG